MDPNSQNPQNPYQQPEQTPPTPQPQPQPIPTQGLAAQPSMVTPQPQTQGITNPPQEQVFVGGVALETIQPPPQAPTVGAVPEPQTVNGSSMQDTSGKKRFLKLAIVIVVAVLGITVIIGGVIYVVGKLNNGPKKYSIGNLVTIKESGYSFSYPNGWKDGKDIDEVKSIVNSASGFQNPVVFADSVIKGKDGKLQAKYAAVFTGSSNVGDSLTNDQVQQLIGTPALKAEYEQEFKSSFTSDTLKSDSNCASVSNYQQSVSYLGAFPIELKQEGDCILSADQQQQKGTASVHLITVAGFLQSSSYFLTISAKKQSWDINKEIYNKMFADFKAN